VLNAGDVTERGWAEEYDDVDRAFAGLSMPVHMAPGNHDVRWAPLGLQIFADRVGPSHQFVFEHRGCVFVQLDSTVPLSHWGHVGGPQRRWLERELARFGADAPLFVFLHHAPGRTPAAVDDDDALGDVLARFNTKVIFTGHGHNDLIWEWRGFTLTMARGLYQGSYLRVDVDADADEIRLSRRTAAAPVARPFATRPLARRPHFARAVPATLRRKSVRCARRGPGAERRRHVASAAAPRHALHQRHGRQRSRPRRRERQRALAGCYGRVLPLQPGHGR
jgi:hypothetical protein